MAMFATRRDSAIFMVTPSTPPTTTSVLADGYTDEPLSRMGSRRQSRFSYESMNGRRHGSRASTSMLSDSSIVDQVRVSRFSSFPQVYTFADVMMCLGVCCQRWSSSSSHFFISL
ncbi:hypothetical protein AB6A40_002540 [Gnathostoma spinigerum]|uniref:Uncharacterized protein n=1 Tax=Gnathostoma spinigerum TaxID=75299 RepID=A0ABD6E883_9BILA